ncbi:MAG TPA: cupin domain-containing protein [Thermoproteales archaeon]|nr:cupin domain-containing protein [Thermoproteales archaeon]
MKSNFKEVKVEIDPEVGVGLAKLVEGENVSLHLAVATGKLREHYHKQRDEIYIILEGEGVLTINGKEIRVKPGDVILIPKGSKHSIKPLDKELKFLFASAPPFNPKEDRFFTN